MFEKNNFKAYIESSKPKVVALMIFTSFIGMLLANPLALNFEVLIIGNLGIALMSLSAGSINQLLDQKIDSIMLRTKKRPLVMGVLAPKNVVIYAVVLALIGFLLLSIFSYFTINSMYQKILSLLLVLFLGTQVLLGVLNIKLGLPILVAVAHNGNAALLLMCLVTQLFFIKGIKNNT